MELDGIRESDQIFDIKGEYWGISGYLNLLSIVDLFIGPSTGPTHLAAALGKTCCWVLFPYKNSIGGALGSDENLPRAQYFGTRCHLWGDSQVCG